MRKLYAVGSAKSVFAVGCPPCRLCAMGDEGLPLGECLGERRRGSEYLRESECLRVCASAAFARIAPPGARLALCAGNICAHRLPAGLRAAFAAPPRPRPRTTCKLQSARDLEYATARYMALLAMMKLTGGAHTQPLPRHTNTMAPRWPPGIVGSISHYTPRPSRSNPHGETPPLRVAVVAYAHKYPSIGIDCEQRGRISEKIYKRVFQPAEIAQIAQIRQITSSHSADLASILFSAKEAAIKALSYRTCNKPAFGSIVASANLHPLTDISADQYSTDKFPTGQFAKEKHRQENPLSLATCDPLFGTVTAIFSPSNQKPATLHGAYCLFGPYLATCVY